MSIQQIPTILKSMSPQFSHHEAIKITRSQYNMMKEVIQDYCLTHDAPRLYGILGRISRRMKKASNPHLWHTEFEYFADSMMGALKEENRCRLEDGIENIDEIFERQNNDSEPGHNRQSDRPQILSIFG